MKETVLFVILTYFPKSNDLVRLVTSLTPHQVLMVDNTSGSDKSVMQAAAKFAPNVAVRSQGTNTGYAGGMNLGILHGLSGKTDWIVLVNDDIRVPRHSIESFISALSGAPKGLAGPHIGSLDPARWTTILPESGHPDTAVRYVSGSFLAVHRSVAVKIGLLYEPYFMYYEDADYAVRALRAGFPVTEIPLAGLEHPQKKPNGRELFNKLYYLSRNHLLFVERNAPPGVKAHEFARMPKTLFEHYMNGELGSVYGIRDFALRKFGKLKEHT